MKYLSNLPLLCLIASPCLWAQEAPSVFKSPYDQTLNSIGELESKRDPKCYATASRLEDFMYGTPLTDGARHEKNDLQKALIYRVWTRADENARAAGRSSIDGDSLRHGLSGIWKSALKSEEGWTIETHEGLSLHLSKRDVRQYSSVAYSLRAILAIQQEQLLRPGQSILALEEEAFSILKVFLDLYSLATLQVADRTAREADQYEVDTSRLRRAWKSLGVAHIAADTPPAIVLQANATSAEPYALTQKIISAKLEAYQAYNEISNPVFFRNIQVYFARHRWPTESNASDALKEVFTEMMIDYSIQILQDSEAISRANSHALVRIQDVQQAIQQLIPYTVNRFEDVTYFPRFDQDNRIVIESFDLDAFRDGGLHWQYLRAALAEPDFKGQLEPDPFALELIAENIAQFGVLFLRVCGQMATQHDTEVLEGTHMKEAFESILQRISKHRALPEDDNQQTQLASAPDTSTDTSSKALFTDVTQRVGLDFTHRSSDWLNRLIRSYSVRNNEVAVLAVPPAFGGSGAASADLNGDGYPDLLLLSGSGNKLYMNNGQGGFDDVTESSGIDWRRPDRMPGEPRQPLIADLDNDGLKDIIITYVDDPHRVYRNLGNGHFEDVTAQAGLGGKGLVGGPATVVDIDNDGLLDLYITYFGQYIEGILPTLSRYNENGLPNRLFKNLGNMRFEDITENSGVSGKGWTQATGHTDFNLDGWQDLIEGNDFGVNAYYQNQGDGTFINVAKTLGTDKPSYTMSIGIADLNEDRYPDIYISNIVTMDKDQKYVNPSGETSQKFDADTLAQMRVVEANDLFVSTLREGIFDGYVQSTAVGRGKSSTGWAWGADFLDMDNDGDDDLYVANGMNEFSVYSTEHPYYRSPEGEERNVQFPESTRETNVLFRNEGGKLSNVSAESGADIYGNSRAVVYMDFDLDGDLDMVLNNYHEPAVFLQNNAETLGNHWLTIELIGDPEQGVSRDAIGARLILTTEEGEVVWREIHGGSGYLTMNPTQQHFGLAKATRASVEVIWPGNKSQHYSGLDMNTRYRIDQRTGELSLAVGGRSVKQRMLRD